MAMSLSSVSVVVSSLLLQYYKKPIFIFDDLGSTSVHDSLLAPNQAHTSFIPRSTWTDSIINFFQPRSYVPLNENDTTHDRL